MLAKKSTKKGNIENYENENFEGEKYEVTVYLIRLAHFVYFIKFNQK